MLNAIPETVRCPGSGQPLALRRAWPRRAEHVLCEYAGPDRAPVAGQWFADPGRLRDAAAATPGLVTALERDGVLLQRRGADRRLPALRPLVEEPGAALLTHRPERRAVVRLPAPDTVLYAKVVRPGRAAQLAARTARAAAQAGNEFRTPAVRHLDDAAGVLVLEEVTGRSLFDLGAAPQAATAWSAAGTALAQLHQGDLGGVPTHTAADEAAVTERWLSHAATFAYLPRIDARRALSPLRDDPPATLGLLHRDLHDKQLVHQAGAPLGVLDTDTLAVGERALDIANLLVHLELRVRQGRMPAPAAAAARRLFLVAYDPDRETRRRLEAYACAARLRLAAVYAFRPAWRRLARDLLLTSVAEPVARSISADERAISGRPRRRSRRGSSARA